MNSINNISFYQYLLGQHPHHHQSVMTPPHNHFDSAMANAYTTHGNSMTGVCQAVQVGVDEFAASLYTFSETQHTINTLRLCVIYGKGPHAWITDLPQEVLGMIEGYVKGPVLARWRRKLGKLLACVEGRCKPDDHYTLDQLIEVQKQLETSSRCACGCKQLSNVAPMQQYVDTSDQTRYQHGRNISSWMKYLDMNASIPHGPYARPEGFFAKLVRGFEQRFRLRVLLLDFDLTMMPLPVKRSVIAAYIVHPGYAQFVSTHINDLPMGSSMATSMEIPQQLLTIPDSEKRLFRWAMAQLCLKQKIRPITAAPTLPAGLVTYGPVDNQEERGHRAKEMEAKEYPQLTCLVRASSYRPPH